MDSLLTLKLYYMKQNIKEIYFLSPPPIPWILSKTLKESEKGKYLKIFINGQDPSALTEKKK